MISKLPFCRLVLFQHTCSFLNNPCYFFYLDANFNVQPKEKQNFLRQKEKKCKTNIFVGGGVCKDKESNFLFPTSNSANGRTDGGRDEP
jgi:hypothetical protein